MKPDDSADPAPAPVPAPVPAPDGIGHPSRSGPRAWYLNPAARSWVCPPAPPGAGDFHRTLPGYAPTPLVDVPALAAELGVGRVFVKDESARLGLPAFKVLGASWAVFRALGTRSGDGAPRTLDELRSTLAGVRPVRLIAATDGNHGRAVAYMARLLGLGSRIFVAEGVRDPAIAAIAGEGAEVVRGGAYDDTVRRAREAASGTGELLVQDTAWPDYLEIPGWIVEGYATLFDEVDAQLAAAGADPARLVAVPAGVGSLAQAAVIHHRGRGDRTVAVLAVEPDTAACVGESLRCGRLRSVRTGVTAMAGLNCGTPSGLAWPYLRDGLDAAITVTDPETDAAARDLGALGISAGPCGAAALAGVRAALGGEEADGRAGHRAELGTGVRSTVVLLSTEGAPGAVPQV